MKIAQSVADLVGNTPLVKLQKASQISGANILAKCEFMNPNGSIKDRIGVYMLQQSLADKTIDYDTTVIEPTSGNTGVALASYCASLGMKLILTMPDSMSIERIKLLKAFGAELVLTPASQGMNGAISKALELNKSISNSIILQQFKNRYNPQIHQLSTAKEILRDTDGNVDLFVASVGTGGTLSGVAKGLKESLKDIDIFAVEPKNSAVLSGEDAGEHKIQGIGAGFIPEILDTTCYDGVLKVSDEDAYATARALAREEGLLVGISSGANIWATTQIASQPKYHGKTVVTILCDTGERYLSTDLFI